MIKKLKNLIKRTIGIPQYIIPISDQISYGLNVNSFAGNSLSYSNVLVVTNLLPETEENHVLNMKLDNEKCQYDILFMQRTEITIEQIRSCGQDLIGPFEHIINLIWTGEESNCSYVPLENPMKDIYKLLQLESEYMINLAQYGTLCTAIVNSSIPNINRTSALAGVESLIKGLGGVLAKHKIIENGVSADADIPFDDVLATAIFLSSKYGQILAGEVLCMKS